MKLYYLFIFLLFFHTIRSQTDTIHHHSLLDSAQVVRFSNPPTQMARFLSKGANKIVGLQLHFGGLGTGTCEVRIYGHEGGISVPPFKKDLHPPIKVSKTKSGEESIDISFSKPVLLNGNQFFVVVDNFKGNFGLRIDQSLTEEPCSDKDSGTFYPSYIAGRGRNVRLAISVLVEKQNRNPIYKDITELSGIQLTHSNRSIAWGDVNNDNWLDLLIGGYLYINEKGKFKNSSFLLPLKNKWRVQGSVFIDIENDGDEDILLMDKDKNYLFVNNGKGQFSKKVLRLPVLSKPIGISIADINNDQLPDMVVAQLWSAYPTPLPNYLFLNNGALDFTDVSKKLYPSKQPPRRSRGAQFTDYDLDGDLDLFITNYFLEPDEFYENDGAGNFKPIPPPFTKNPKNAKANHGTGVDWYDFDNDGDFDLLLPQLAHPRYMDSNGHQSSTIFRNDNGKFIDLKSQHGIEYEETHAGATFGDVNNDGLVDIIMTVFYPCRYVSFYLQQPNHTFKLSTGVAGLSNISTGADACFVDYNNDGLLDLAMGEDNKFRLFKNENLEKNNWLKVKLKGTSINQASVGAKVKVYTKKNIYTQEVVAGRGKLMQKPLVLHFGLKKEKKIKKIEVYWSKDHVEEFKRKKVNQFYHLTEGTGKKKRGA